AQQLYEGVELGDEGSVALITYMRTDSTRVSPGAAEEARQWVAATYGADHLPDEPPVYRSKKAAQDAHEAIRPTSLAYPPERVKAHLTPEQYKLYALVWRFYCASQMVPAVYAQVGVDVEAGDYALRATGSQLIFAGYLAVHQDVRLGAADEAPEEAVDAEASGGTAQEQLLALRAGQALTLQQLTPAQHFTQPPPRFSESTLVRELEECGIGRPSTYATILSTIVTRGYVLKDEGRFFPTELGLLVTELLTASFPQVLDVAFTAAMEEKLDDVETGSVDWVQLLHEFYFGGFADALERAKVEMRDVKREETPTDHACTDCGQTMLLKWGRNGSFLACSGYPDCRNTRDYVRRPDGTLEVVPEVRTDARCPTCSGEMVVKRGRFGQFIACANYPACKGTRPMSIGVDCPSACGSYVAERRSKRGRTFYGCAGYPNCTFVSWDRPVAGPCPSCGASYLLRKYSRKDGVTIRCPDKACGYTRDPELDDADARAVAG
ncbi:DNA topoisomerase, partial [Jatrophihabitans endophyticus]|uniref:DNA topoisomerase family protein n=1 Tax=Jatrophihabitans endophyticus TaxID=1206085 RepID=UPI0019E4DC22